METPEQRIQRREQAIAQLLGNKTFRNFTAESIAQAIEASDIAEKQEKRRQRRLQYEARSRTKRREYEKHYRKRKRIKRCRPNEPGKCPAFRTIRDNLILDLYAGGMLWKQIAYHAKVSEPTISDVLHAAKDVQRRGGQKVNTEIHLIRAQYEWAYIIADDATGLFLSYGSFGTFAHQWSPQHRGQPLAQFLAHLDCDYFMKKTRDGKHMAFDINDTTRAMKSGVIDYRRQNQCTKQQARGAWNAIEDAADNFATDENGFFNDLYNDPDIDATIGHADFWEWSRFKLKADCKGFWEIIWPEFLKLIAPKEIPA